MRCNFYDTHIQQQMAHAGLESFESLWNIEQNWVEPINRRRQGWSGVTKLELPGITPLFIKRQENHNTRTLLHPLRGVPTYQRELDSILLFQKHDIPTLTPIYYGERIIDGNYQAILITVALEGYHNLLEVNGQGDEQRTRQALTELARVTRDMHDHGFAHYCLYPTHVFARFHDQSVDVRLIDLEKVRRDPLQERMRLKDLFCFLRHASDFTGEARSLFINHYLSFEKNPRTAEKLRSKLEVMVTNLVRTE